VLDDAGDAAVFDDDVLVRAGRSAGAIDDGDIADHEGVIATDLEHVAGGRAGPDNTANADDEDREAEGAERAAHQGATPRSAW
jgi:hypothetical protein